MNNEFKRMQKLAGLITENKDQLNKEKLEQDVVDFWGVQQDDAAQSNGEYKAEWENEFFIDNYPEYKGMDSEINDIVKKLKIKTNLKEPQQGIGLDNLKRAGGNYLSPHIKR